MGIQVDVSEGPLRRLAEERAGVHLPLHKYQWDGVSFLYRSSSALLADEMGLGKTVQTAVALALLLNGEEEEVERALIVAPTALTVNWMAELATWAPSVVTRRVGGSVPDREAFYLLPIPVLVCSYEQIREDGLDRIPSDSFDLVVLDEAQRIKNRNSATALACRLLPRKRSWALSATPLENCREDVESILDFLDPEVGRYLTTSQLSNKLENVMLRRRKREVRAELPSVIIQDLELDLSARQQERYDELWATRASDIVREGNGGSHIAAMLGLITRLKGICNYDSDSGESTKLSALRMIGEGAGVSAKMIVFSQFVETLRGISARFDMAHDVLEGSMALPARQVVMDRFRSGESPRALLVSLRAGGVGLNLGEASHVVLFDRWWNPAVEVQAMYRAHRFDREEPLHVVRFLVRDTIEERIVNILKRKEHLFDEVVESAVGRGEGLTAAELREILGLANGDQETEPRHT